MQGQALSEDLIREFVIAGHGNLNRVKQMLAEHPNLLNASHKWGENDHETAIQAAAQVGNVPIAEFLLSKGAPLEICTLAILGRVDGLRERLDKDPENVKAVGAHGIPLLPHAVLSANLELVRLVYERGATAGANLALHNAIAKGSPEVVEWLLANAKPDVNAKNYQGKSPLAVARERNDQRLVELLNRHGATE